MIYSFEVFLFKCKSNCKLILTKWIIHLKLALKTNSFNVNIYLENMFSIF